MALTPQSDGPGLNSVLSGTGAEIWGALGASVPSAAEVGTQSLPSKVTVRSK